MDALKLETLVRFQDWPASIWLLLAGLLVTGIAQLSWRPSFPSNAPQAVKDSLPVFGSLRFFSDRYNFIRQAAAATKSGNFSFYYGKHRIVSVSGFEGRKTFFESKDLNMTEGYAVLFTAAPGVPDSANDPENAFDKWFSRTIVALMKKENFVKNLSLLVGDTKASLDRLGNEGIFDPFDDIYKIVYQLTQRTVGAKEIAESPEMLAKTLHLFEVIEDNVSPSNIIFPWLPTPNRLRKTIAGGRLYFMLDKIVKDRKESGRREDDALQFLIDGGDDLIRILSFIMGALFAGQLNSGINAAWMFIYLATNSEWYERVQNEVDGVIKKHRAPGQSATDVLASLSVDDWESEFPAIDLCLRECIRLQLVGTAFRKNLSGKDVPIGKTGEVIPKDGFAVYLLDDIHFNPEIYTEPHKWDPSRYLPDRAEDRKKPVSYVGWGTGRHPCLGMRFAKLEMSVIAATFVAMFDYEYVDASGNVSKVTPEVNRSKHSAHKPAAKMRLKYKLRQDTPVS